MQHPLCRSRRPPSPLAARSVVCVCVLLAESALPAAACATGRTALAVASIDQTISNITAWIVGILAGLATMFLTVGGLRYLMAGGDPGEVEKAKNAVRGACIGYLVALLAPAIVTVLKGLVGA